MMARLLRRREMAKNLFALELVVDGLETKPVAGQFFMLYPPRDDLVLGRPISAYGCRVEGGASILEFLVKRVGGGTAAILDLPEGAELRLLGPLGSGFDAEPEADRICLVAGGYGVAPLRFYMRSLLDAGRDVYLVHGYKRAEEILSAEELGLPADRVFCACESDAGVFVGTAFELWRSKVAEIGAGLTVACGPAGLLKALQCECERNGWPLSVSLEARMGCGFGVCFSCAVPMKGGGYARACYDGPVFDASAIDWDRFDSA